MAANEYYTGQPAVHPQDLYGGSPAPQSHHSQGPPPPYEPLPPQQPHQQFQGESKPQYPQQGYAHTNGDYGYQQQPQHYQQYPPQQYQQYPPQQQSQYYNAPTSYPYQQPPPAETGSLQRPSSQGTHSNGHKNHVAFDDRPYSASPRPHDRRSSTPHSRHSHHSRSPSRDRHHRDSSRSSHARSASGSGSGKRKKGNLDTFVGAGGGAIIGDAIFPGLGTVGGALLGGWGGNKVAKDKRRDSEDLRHLEEYHNDGRRHRSRSSRSFSDSDSEKERRRRH